MHGYEKISIVLFQWMMLFLDAYFVIYVSSKILKKNEKIVSFGIFFWYFLILVI